jgi:hypothetical protein
MLLGEPELEDIKNRIDFSKVFKEKYNKSIASKKVVVNMIKELDTNGIFENYDLMIMETGFLFEMLLPLINMDLNITPINCKGHDYVDVITAKKSESKFRTAKTKRTNISAMIPCCTIEGDLRVMVYEGDVTNEHYFFLIPYEEVKPMRYIEIPFNLKTGEPYRKNRWWGYEVKTLKEAAGVK